MAITSHLVVTYFTHTSPTTTHTPLTDTRHSRHHTFTSTHVPQHTLIPYTHLTPPHTTSHLTLTPPHTTHHKLHTHHTTPHLTCSVQALKVNKVLDVLLPSSSLAPVIPPVAVRRARRQDQFSTNKYCWACTHIHARTHTHTHTPHTHTTHTHTSHTPHTHTHHTCSHLLALSWLLDDSCCLTCSLRTTSWSGASLRKGLGPGQRHNTSASRG